VYFPFGGGPRVCIGDRFATMEAALILATLARRFRLERTSEEEIVPFPSITLRPEGGVPLKLVRRRPQEPPPPQDPLADSRETPAAG
jgi:cytochrome P450